MLTSVGIQKLLLLSLLSASYVLAQETVIPPSPIDSTAQVEGEQPETTQIAEPDTAAAEAPSEKQAIKLNATVIRASRAKAVKRQAYNVNAIDVTAVKEKNVTVNEVLNQSSGVVVREEGGMGSGSTISLNGMSGNQVRVFLDGLPIDAAGPAMSMGNIPPNTLEMIEVYKGVVPIYLGADALGGAINIVTNSRFTSFLDASYAYSSFNTHRTTVTGQWVPDSSGVLLKAGVFLNSSDNDYKNLVKPQIDSGRYGPEQNLRRFHDAYSSYAGSIEAGVFRKKYADLASISYSRGHEHDDIQHAVSMDRVYGMVFNESNSDNIAAKYRKRDILLEGLSLTAFGTYTRTDYKAMDTAARIYDWYGNYVPNLVTSKGESQWEKLHYTAETKALASNVSLSYSFLETNEIALNYAQSRYTILTVDHINPFTYNFDKPSVLQNHVYAGAYKKSLFDARWVTTVFAKLYRTTPLYRTYDYDNSVKVVRTADETFPGYGLATTYFPSPSIQTKFSYENAVRVPEIGELFGDGILQDDNTGLNPERSHNVNVGALFAQNYSDFRLSAESNVFFREVTNLIYSEILGATSMSKNLGSVRIAGIEGELGLDYRRILEARVNATYDHAINTTEFENGLESDVYLDRIPNRPYLYGNTYFAAHWANPAGLSGKASLSLDSRFVHSYFLFWESQGDASNKFIIPGQFSHNAALVYSGAAERYSLALECENLTDELLYDNFRQQKPGRSLSAKVRVSL